MWLMNELEEMIIVKMRRMMSGVLMSKVSEWTNLDITKETSFFPGRTFAENYL